METQIVISLTNVLTIVGGFILIFTGAYKLLARKFDIIDKKFDKIEADFKEVKSELKQVSEKISAFDKSTEHRLTKLEMEAKSTNQRLTTIEGFLMPRKIYRIERSEDDEPKEN